MDNKDLKIRYFANQTFDAFIIGVNTIRLLSNLNKDWQNEDLVKIVKIIEIIYDLHKLVEHLPQDDFKTKMKRALSKKLKMYTCYSQVDGLPINCLDFYNNYLKRKEVNSQILKEVKKQEGGMGGIMLTAAITALAILNASVSVTASVFNSDKFVDQQLAKRGIEKEPPSFFNSAKERVLSVFGKSQPNPNVLSTAEFYRYNELEINYAGKCAYLAYIAELCLGGCPTEEEWLKRDPNIVNEIIDSQSDDIHWQYKSTMGIDETARVGTAHMIGVGYFETHSIHVPQENRQDPEWFREYFSSGDKSYKQGDKSDVAIATIIVPGHALNMLYNRNTQKLCIHEVDAEWEKDFYLFKYRPPSYICEEGFFTNDQLDKLDKVGTTFRMVNVVSPGTNIISYYGEIINKNTKIFHISPSERIFLHNNENNSGNINEYISIHEKVNDAIIQGKDNAFKIMKEHQEELNLNPEIVKIYGSIVDITEKILKDPPNQKKYNEEIKTLEEKANKINKEEKKKRIEQAEREEGLMLQQREQNQQLVPYDTNRELVPYNKKQGTHRGGKRNRKSRRSRTFKKKRR